MEEIVGAHNDGLKQPIGDRLPAEPSIGRPLEPVLLHKEPDRDVFKRYRERVRKLEAEVAGLKLQLITADENRQELFWLRDVLTLIHQHKGTDPFTRTLIERGIEKWAFYWTLDSWPKHIIKATRRALRIGT